ncbi:unnamed protein product [Brassica rapa]|uniref:Uncharacterized protein n=1 Tax=Brassica campestris TaxID=3711 RepID=A0A3P5YDA1_BRACM|nr:unnamed protein product [Brassica rapa]VDC65662.1 unnamed protein product [Brassica rapa]
MVQHVAISETLTLFQWLETREKLMAADEKLLCYGGCVVGSVLDEDYKVNGVKRLRAVDSSTFKESQGTKPTSLGKYQGIFLVPKKAHNH